VRVLTPAPTCPAWCLRFLYSPPATSQIYILSLHDALPISIQPRSLAPASPRRLAAPPHRPHWRLRRALRLARPVRRRSKAARRRSEEHTSELQSRENLVCRLLLEKKKKKTNTTLTIDTTST